MHAGNADVVRQAVIGDGARDDAARWNATEVAYPYAAVHESFAALALAQPEHTAVIFEGKHTSYRELDQRANPVFLMGPGLNAASMAGLGWLDQSRVWSSSNHTVHARVRLRPLHRRDLPGFLAARLGQYLVEFRDKSLWDQGIFEPVVLVHRFDDAHSYVMNGNAGTPGLRAGETFGNAPLPPPAVTFGSVLRVEVVAIDADAKFADLNLVLQPGIEVPSIGSDTFFVNSAGDVVVENAGEGTDLVRTTLSTYTLGNDVEGVLYDGSAAFTGNGNGLNNNLTGGRGADTLSGLAGNDALDGGAGNDSLDGGSGNDAMRGGAGNDTYVVDSTGD